MAKSIPGGVEIVNTLSTKNDGNYPLVKAESVGMADGTTAEDNIKKKLDKNQGTQNNGKFMRVGADGNLVPDDVPIPDVSGQIKEHNENTDSHQDIRTELKKKANSGTTLSDYGITDAVPDSHLTDIKAHEDIRKETAKLKEDLTKLTKNEYIDLSKVSFEKGKYVNANTGRLENISSGETSDFIDVHNLKKITILNYSNPDLVSYLKNVGMAFYDKNKLKTTAIQYSDTNNMTVEVSGYYFRFTKFGNPNGTVIHIDNFWEEHISDFNKAKDDIAFLKEKVFPINPAKYHGKEFLSFSKCACIGDSLTAGVFNSNSAGYTEYIPIEKYSYPTYMKKHFGIEAVNWGKSGETTKGWYEKAISENWTGYDCAIINLGANDSQLSDSNDSKKYLKMIVDKLKTSNKGIKIFITTLLPNYYSNMGDIRDIVNNRAKEIAAENADCYLVDLTTYSACKDNTVYSQGHLTALGYQKEAEELVAYISYLINQNKDDFKYIHFINTNYSFN